MERCLPEQLGGQGAAVISHETPALPHTTAASRAAAASAAKHDVCLAPTGETYTCSEAESLLQGMARLGRKGIPVGCLNGGCGVCKIRIIAGRVRRIGAMSRAHVSQDEEAQGICLACRVAPLGRVEVAVVGKMKKAWSDQWIAVSQVDGSKREINSDKE
ncbi:2Fe-2S iron-sulfur cluster binding domain-containing protein [Ramlibacter sp. AW1]|uniref:2Fe-2S iron-sulfur cluster binding domain-containing protein n=1 Tax=Ramlibacter aurantiacus TaxID=2801330 RepID=A0A936ZXR9_9BURK|nr:2Fe-2S iron-sulfur cluster binding domain-containing protein [Ramlibacter aurantiacus]